MDLAHKPSPLSRLERIEGVLQQYEAMMTAAGAEAKQAAQAGANGISNTAAVISCHTHSIC